MQKMSTRLTLELKPTSGAALKSLAALLPFILWKKKYAGAAALSPLREWYYPDAARSW
jgi:hypothetical protein